MLMALIAGLALPTQHRPTGPLTLRVAANGVQALLREARTAAIDGGRPIAATIDGTTGAVEAEGRRLVVPAGIAMALAVPGHSGIDFAPDGSSSGGTVLLKAASSQIGVRVEGETGAISLVR